MVLFNFPCKIISNFLKKTKTKLYCVVSVRLTYFTAKQSKLDNENLNYLSWRCCMWTPLELISWTYYKPNTYIHTVIHKIFNSYVFLKCHQAGHHWLWCRTWYVTNCRLLNLGWKKNPSIGIFLPSFTTDPFITWELGVDLVVALKGRNSWHWERYQSAR